MYSSNGTYIYGKTDTCTRLLLLLAVMAVVDSLTFSFVLFFQMFNFSKNDFDPNIYYRFSHKTFHTHTLILVVVPVVSVDVLFFQCYLLHLPIQHDIYTTIFTHTHTHTQCAIFVVALKLYKLSLLLLLLHIYYYMTFFYVFIL